MKIKPVGSPSIATLTNFLKIEQRTSRWSFDIGQTRRRTGPDTWPGAPPRSCQRYFNEHAIIHD
jgi:hypothetical protein